MTREEIRDEIEKRFLASAPDYQYVESAIDMVEERNDAIEKLLWLVREMDGWIGYTSKDLGVRDIYHNAKKLM